MLHGFLLMAARACRAVHRVAGPVTTCLGACRAGKTSTVGAYLNYESNCGKCKNGI
jgi:hypothetical protein